MDKPLEDMLNLKSRVLKQARKEGIAKLESGISWPIPFNDAHRIYLKFLIYPTTTNPSDKKQIIYRPSGLINYNLLTGTIDSQRNFSQKDPITEKEVFPDKDELIKLSKEEYEILLTRYSVLQMELMMAFFLNELTGKGIYDENERLKFLELFELLTPNILKQYYFDFGGDFFFWLRKYSPKSPHALV